MGSGLDAISFHSTLNALEGLLAHDAATGGTDATHAARRGGEEYLLERAFFRRLSTGEPLATWVDGCEPDPRMADAMALTRAARQPDGTWIQAGRQPGRVWFEIDVPAGQPSPWLTLIGTRVLDGWDSNTPQPPSA